MASVRRPSLEGSVAVRDGRRLSFAEYGVPRGRPIIWLHGTPGARRQIPLPARAFAERHGLRLIGIDRPGVGSSTPHLYENVLDFGGDLEALMDNLGIETAHVVGLSGGGPYTLAAGAALPHRVHGLGVLGGVAPTVGPDAAEGGLMQLAYLARPLLVHARVPVSAVLAGAIRLAKPVAGPAIDLYASVQPAGDRRLLARPEFRAMLLDDLINGSRSQLSAPLSDLVLFTRHWGFEAADVTVPVGWWHGDADHIVPLRHGQGMVERLPQATMTVIDGESHFGGLGVVEDVLTTLLDLGPRRSGPTGQSAPHPSH